MSAELWQRVCSTTRHSFFMMPFLNGRSNTSLDVVFLELCSQRVGVLMDPPPVQPSAKGTKGNREKASLAQRFGDKYAKIQSDLATKLNATIGGEFRSACQAAVHQNRQLWASATASPGQADSGSLPHQRANRPCAVISLLTAPNSSLESSVVLVATCDFRKLLY